MPDETSGHPELIIRIHPVGGDDVSFVTADFAGLGQAVEVITRALNERRSLVLTQARSSREPDTSAVVINLANVIAARVSEKNGAAGRQIL
ncbi:hypothetical protein [Actinomadura keratinilytica]|jgi:hypothetical protein|uniref:Uncharacterized protein n=1 Tax=Actinomadura keratinilytica TaxID=547461 RepID=A0ABP7Y004_9ACTN